MRFIEVSCFAPEEMKGSYYFDYLGDFLWFMRQFSITAKQRHEYVRKLLHEGKLSIDQENCRLTAIIDLPQYHLRYR